MIKRIYFFIVAICSLQAGFGQTTEEKTKAGFKTDISFLASDQMQGRLAGSPQDKESADYIAEQFSKAGLTPFNGQTFQTFDITQFRIATNKSLFQFHFPSGDSTLKTTLVLFRDFWPISESGMNDSAYGVPVYCGYGIQAPSLNYDSYKKLTDLKGKVFVISNGFPGDDTAPHGALEPFAEMAVKIKTAIDNGAAGIVIIPGSHNAEVPKGELQRNATTFPITVIYLNKEFYPRFNMFLKIKTVIGAPTAKAYNVMGFRNNHKKNTIIVCAHHDHLGHNEFNNSLYTGPSAIHNGADDNASGVAEMLQLARTLKGKKYKKNNYLFVSFSGEELGLLGSKYFIKQNIIPLNKINYVVNIDMLGRMDSTSHALIVSGTGTSPTWNKSILKLKNDSNIVKIVPSLSGLGPSDHASFYLEGIPVLHYFTGQHADYHKPSDDENKINYDGMYRANEVILKMISATNKAGKLKFTKTVDVQQGKRSFKVTMGIMPDYTFTGQGLRVDGVSDGKPAKLAGLERGDIIVKLGDFVILNIQDYMKALGSFNKGQKVPVQIIRNGENKTLEVTF